MKRPSKEFYKKCSTSGPDTFLCYKCGERGLTIYRLDKDRMFTELSSRAWNVEDEWLCPLCYDGLDKKPEENKPDYYEGLTVFPLLNGLK